jgi:hypothetical protein
MHRGDDLARDCCGQIRPLAEQRLVARDLLGPVLCEGLEEVLADSRP